MLSICCFAQELNSYFHVLPQTAQGMTTISCISPKIVYPYNALWLPSSYATHRACSKPPPPPQWSYQADFLGWNVCSVNSLTELRWRPEPAFKLTKTLDHLSVERAINTLGSLPIERSKDSHPLRKYQVQISVLHIPPVYALGEGKEVQQHSSRRDDRNISKSSLNSGLR